MLICIVAPTSKVEWWAMVMRLAPLGLETVRIRRNLWLMKSLMLVEPESPARCALNIVDVGAEGCRWWVSDCLLPLLEQRCDRGPLRCALV